MRLREASHELALKLPGAVAAVTSRLPLPVAESLGARTGNLLGLLPNRLRRHALANLALSFPDQPVASRAAIAREALTHAGREVGATMRWYLLGRERLPRICENYAELAATIRRDLEPGRGAIYAGGHFGNPQLLSALCATVVPVTGIVNAYHGREHMGFIAAGRQRLGVRYIPRDSPPLDLLRAVQRNELVTFLPDAHPRRKNGLWLPFFGVPACTTTFPAAMARLTGCVLRPVFLVREGRRYRAVIRESLAPPRPERGDAELERVMLEWTATLEEEVRRRPGQWVWMSRRWRTMPPGSHAVERPARVHAS